MLNGLLYLILFLLIGGAGAGWLITLIGVSWIPAILLTMLAILMAIVLLARVGSITFVTWWREDGLFTAGYLAGFLSAMATWFWFDSKKPVMGWAALILLVVAVICFIRYSCRWNNWCHHFNQWWTATGLPRTRAAWTRVFTWFRGPFLHSVVVTSRTTGNALGFVAQNVQIVHVKWLLLLVTGYGLLHSIFQGPLWISTWLWALLFAVAILWRFAEARAVVRATGQWLRARYVANWNRLSGLWQGWFVISAILLIPMVLINLLQERARPGTGMLTKFCGISASSYNSWGEITIPGILLIGGGLYLGWLVWQGFVSHTPRPLTPAQQRVAARVARRATRHAAVAHP